MSKLGPVKPRTLIKFLKKQGFEEVRQKGSHKFFRHQDGRTTVVPFHKGKEIGSGLLRSILNDVDVSRDYFLRFK